MSERQRDDQRGWRETEAGKSSLDPIRSKLQREPISVFCCPNIIMKWKRGEKNINTLLVLL